MAETVVTLLGGDLFDSQAQTLTNTVNCIGVMGRGIAAGFKARYPEMFRDYQTRCKSGLVRPGEPYLYRQAERPWVLNFPTKNHFRYSSKLAWIDEGLARVVERYREWGIESLAMPALGCNHGGLKWSAVEPLMRRYLERLDIPVEIYPPLLRADEAEKTRQ